MRQEKEKKGRQMKTDESKKISSDQGRASAHGCLLACGQLFVRGPELSS